MFLNKNDLKKFFGALLDVLSWFVGSLFVNKVSVFVMANTWTVAGFMDLGVGLFATAAFFLVKFLADDLLDGKLDAKKVLTKKEIKSLKKLAKANKAKKSKATKLRRKALLTNK